MWSSHGRKNVKPLSNILKTYSHLLPSWQNQNMGNPCSCIYLWVMTEETLVLSLVLEDKDKQQRPVYFVSKVLQGPKLQYSKDGKTCICSTYIGTTATPILLKLFNDSTNWPTNKKSFAKTQLGRPNDELDCHNLIYSMSHAPSWRLKRW